MDDYELMQIGLLHLKKGEVSRAAVQFWHLRRDHPDNTHVQEALGRSLYSLGLYYLAAKEFQTIVDNHPIEDYAHYLLGRSYERIGYGHLARRHYLLARALNPTNPYYQLSLDLFLWNSQ